ncbi:hypothetical protein [Nocardia gipuzkoensis]
MALVAALAGNPPIGDLSAGPSFFLCAQIAMVGSVTVRERCLPRCLQGVHEDECRGRYGAAAAEAGHIVGDGDANSVEKVAGGDRRPYLVSDSVEHRS